MRLRVSGKSPQSGSERLSDTFNRTTEMVWRNGGASGRRDVRLQSLKPIAESGDEFEIVFDEDFYTLTAGLRMADAASSGLVVAEVSLP